jgi:hypothetical protein
MGGAFVVKDWDLIEKGELLRRAKVSGLAMFLYGLAGNAMHAHVG